MPRYDFACEAGHRFELELPFKSALEQPCTRCDKTARRGFNPPLFRYRGMGFYTTDTRKNRRKPEKDPESSGRTGEPPEGGLPQEGETRHGDAKAPTAGIVRDSPAPGTSENGPVGGGASTMRRGGARRGGARRGGSARRRSSAD